MQVTYFLALKVSTHPLQMISMAVCGIRKQSIVINLSGSPKAVRENLSVVLPALNHTVEKIIGSQEECGKV